MKKIVLLVLVFGNIIINNAQEYPVLQSTNKVNNSPWYGLGLSSVTFPSTTANSIQLAGYYGILLKTMFGEISLHENGNVGIGTTNPLEKIDLSKDISWNQVNDSGIKFGNANAPSVNNNKSHSFILKTLGDQYGIRLSIIQQTRLESDKEVFSIKNSNVGIGTTNPDMKLTVKGNIHAEEVKIDLAVPAPDYVFKKDYDLRSIEDVEKFIVENGHLPEIPSAMELEQNGLMLAQMNMNLLKKIEELTLYTIQQEKKIKSQAEKIENLDSINKKLLELQLRLENLESDQNKKTY